MAHKEKNFKPLKADEKTLNSAQGANQSSINASIEKKDIAKTVGSSDEPIKTASNLRESEVRATSIPVEVRASSIPVEVTGSQLTMKSPTKMAGKESTFTGRTGTANES